jgi:hypothetical protein
MKKKNQVVCTKYDRAWELCKMESGGLCHKINGSTSTVQCELRAYHSKHRKIALSKGRGLGEGWVRGNTIDIAL